MHTTLIQPSLFDNKVAVRASRPLICYASAHPCWRVANLYAGVQLNRRKWENVEVTAVELESDIAAVAQDLYPNDKVIVTDAHEFLLRNFRNFDFIWSSRPCTSHSRIRQFVGVKAKGFEPIYPDFGLYEEIVFLQHNAECLWVVENVQPYYEPLIKPTAKIGRHLFWANFEIPQIEVQTQNLRTRNAISQVEELHDLDLSGYKLKNKRQVLRNGVDSALGNHIINAARNAKIDA